jgi:hypothetical protein
VPFGGRVQYDLIREQRLQRVVRDVLVARIRRILHALLDQPAQIRGRDRDPVDLRGPRIVVRAPAAAGEHDQT